MSFSKIRGVKPFAKSCPIFMITLGLILQLQHSKIPWYIIMCPACGGVFTILDKPLSCFVGYIDAVSAPFPQYNHLIYHLHTHHIAIWLVKY